MISLKASIIWKSKRVHLCVCIMWLLPPYWVDTAVYCYLLSCVQPGPPVYEESVHGYYWGHSHTENNYRVFIRNEESLKLKLCLFYHLYCPQNIIGWQSPFHNLFLYLYIFHPFLHPLLLKITPLSHPIYHAVVWQIHKQLIHLKAALATLIPIE